LSEVEILKGCAMLQVVEAATKGECDVCGKEFKDGTTVYRHLSHYAKMQEKDLEDLP